MPTFFTLEKIEKQLIDIRQARQRAMRPITDFKFHPAEAPGAERPAFDDRAWADFHTGDAWGGYDVTAWFRARVPVPPDWQHGRQLALHFQIGPKDGGDGAAEGLLYLNGQPLQALDTWHEEAWLLPEQVGPELAVAIQAWSGDYHIPDRRRLALAQLVWIDLDAHHLTHLLTSLLLAARALDPNDLRRFKLEQALNRAIQRVDFTRPGSEPFYASLRAAADDLDEQVRAWRGLESLKPGVITLGHAHIDMAWLWPVRQTRQKGARTFATALHLMRQYPEYRFMHSSPQLYKFLQQDHPDLFARVKERVQAGAWEATGGMWIEADTNLTGGESLVRQFLYGQRYLRDELGVRGNVLWLPDVFGYSAALPQLIVKSGMKYFLTTKISWSQFNRFPYDTFRWRGLDGTEVLTHFVTTPDIDESFATYNGKVSPHAVKGVWDQYRQKDINDELIVLYGWGDGGGGPTREMLEAGRVLADVPGLPRVTPGLAEPFFDRLEARTAGQPLPVWDGELYLEYHRGTYTSQAAIKRANRQAEILYHNAEWLGAAARLLAGEAFPAEALREGWELILLNQFHDILPGSSIHPVYEDAAADHAHIQELGRSVIAQSQSALLAGIPAEEPSVVVFNPLGWERDELVAVPWSEHMPADQVVQGADGRQALFLARGLPSLGYAAYPLAATASAAAIAPTDALSGVNTLAAADAVAAASASSESAAAPLTITPRRLENAFYRIELNERGQITSLFDKRRARQVLAPGARANVLQVFEDRPMKFDAWDIDIYYQEKMAEVDELIEAAVEETGPLRGVLRLTWRCLDSTLTQRLTLYAHSPRLDFRTEVDWHQHQTLLKVAFPVAVRATRASYEIQFGSVERPTHWNTSWDWARFEVCGHKWADLSEGDYGVALLNDCKYGYDIKNNVLRLTLIKSGIDPDPQADQGRHVFTYSLLPHAGDWRQGGVAREAYALNYPAWAALSPEEGGAPAAGQGRGGAERASLPARFSLAALSADHVILETVKPAETGDAVIFRVYEYQQRRNPAVSLTLGRPIARAVECSLMEDGETPVEHDAASLRFAIAPFEIKTFKVWFQA
jgi:alpha-mannosidase